MGFGFFGGQARGSQPPKELSNGLWTGGYLARAESGSNPQSEECTMYSPLEIIAKDIQACIEAKSEHESKESSKK